MADELDPVAELDVRPHHALGADAHVVADPRVRIDDRGRMDRTVEAHSVTSMALTSASAASAPSTIASPRNHHMFRRFRSFVMW